MLVFNTVLIDVVTTLAPVSGSRLLLVGRDEQLAKMVSHSEPPSAAAQRSESDKLTPGETLVLYGQNAGRCARCKSPVVRQSDVSGRAFNVGQRAHIISRSAVGPRGRPHSTIRERGDLRNHILLCPTCHAEIDRDVEAWPVERLHDLRIRHLAWVAQLDGDSKRSLTFPLLEDIDSLRPSIVQVLRAVSVDDLDQDDVFVADLLLAELRYADVADWVLFASHLSAQSVAANIPGEFDVARSTILALAAQLAGIALMIGAVSLNADIRNPPTDIMPGASSGTEFFATIDNRPNDFASTSAGRVMYSLLVALKTPSALMKFYLSASRLGWLCAIHMYEPSGPG